MHNSSSQRLSRKIPGRKSVTWSNVATRSDRSPRTGATSAAVRVRTAHVFAGVLAVLLATGWAANHFAGLLPAIREHQHLGVSTLDAVFGIYAVGLLPGLLIGGRASDAWGRQPVAWVGSAAALLGTVAMLLSLDSAVLLVGRVIVGVGVGFAISSCTAWASDLRGPSGAAIAGAVLTAGFAIGPFVSGLLASAGQSGIRVSFAIARRHRGVGDGCRCSGRAARDCDRAGTSARPGVVDAVASGQHAGAELGNSAGTVGVRLGDTRFRHDPHPGTHRVRGLRWSPG